MKQPTEHPKGNEFMREIDTSEIKFDNVIIVILVKIAMQLRISLSKLVKVRGLVWSVELVQEKQL